MNFGYSANRDFPPVVKNLLIINILMFVGTAALNSRGTNLSYTLALFYPGSGMFEPWQIVSHFFMHGGLMHLLFNMFTLWMFGRQLEVIWGPKRFLNFYLIAALAAAALHVLATYLQILQYDEAVMEAVKSIGFEKYSQMTMISSYLKKPAELYYSYAVGASGAIMGLLGATYVLFPNTTVYLYGAIPMKMKQFVVLFVLGSLYLAFSDYGWDNIAHFAHLGGLLAGIFIVKYWNKTNRNSFY